jgi:group I intron endonuclease
MLRRQIHNNNHLQNAYNKYGENNFTFEILEFVSSDVIKFTEQKYLNEVSLSPKLYYNINYDADRINYTPEVRKKMSDKAKKFRKENPEYYKQYIKSHSKETIEKIKLARKRQIITDETRKKLSIIRKGKVASEKCKQSMVNAWKLRKNREPKLTDNNVYKFKNKLSNQIFIGRRVDFYKKYNLSRGRIGDLVKHKCKSVKKWILL